MGMIGSAVAFLGPWSWWVLGLVLAGVEVLVPGSTFIWFAVAAVIVGALAFAVDMSWQVEVVLFAVLSLVVLLIGRRYYGGERPPADDGLVNDRLARQVGRVVVLHTAIANGTGQARLDDTVWRVEGPDLPAGTSVRIVGHRGGRLVVEAVAG